MPAPKREPCADVFRWPSNRLADHAKGYMHEALQSLLEFAFEAMKLRRLEADVDPRNKPSIKTLERLGFQREGYLRERWHVAGEIQDAYFYGLLAREWQRPASKLGVE